MGAPTVANTTIEYFDGFDDYNTSQITRYWDSISGNNAGNMIISPGNGRNGTPSLRVNFGGCIANMALRTSQATRTVGFAFKPTTLGAVSGLFAFIDSGNSQLTLGTNINGTLYVTTGSVLGVSTFALSIGVYVYIEFSATINNVTGSFTLKVNGVTWLTASGVNTRTTANNSCNAIGLGILNNNANIFADFDDFYCRADGIFCGDCRVETKLPNANGAINNFTPLAATNFTEVADSPADDDTSYNASALVNDTDLYAYPALTTTAGAVQAVMTCPVMKNDSAGSVQAVSQYRQAGTNYSGGTDAIGSTTYAAYPDIQGFDPSTGAAWTIAGVNSAQFGVKRTA